jgi:hypothetical protein
MSSNNQCKENVRYLKVDEYNKMIEEVKKLGKYDKRFDKYSEEKIMELLKINPWSENLYIPISNKGGKKVKSKKTKSKKTNPKKTRSKKPTKTKTIKNKKNL